MEEAVFDTCRMLERIQLASNHKITVISNSFKKLPKLINIRITDPDSYIGIMLPNRAFFSAI